MYLTKKAKRHEMTWKKRRVLHACYSFSGPVTRRNALMHV